MTSIHNTLFSKLDAILGNIPENKWDTATWVELFHYEIKEYIKSIRDVIRYTNVFSLKYELLKAETDPVDLLGLIIPELKYRKLGGGRKKPKPYLYFVEGYA